MTATMPTTHACERTHRTYQTLAECRWADAGWVVGDGPFALLAHCDLLSVSLFDDLLSARSRKERLDAVGCCRRCTGAHEIVVLADPATTGRSRRSWRRLLRRR